MNLGKLLAVALVTSTCNAADPLPAQRALEPPAAQTAQAAAAQTPQAAPVQTRQTPVGTSSKPDAPAPASAAPTVNKDAALLVDFKTRVDRYLELRKQAAKDAPKLKETNDPANIKAAQEALAARIRALRADAKPGDIFTPEIRATFRRLLAPELKGEDGRDVKEVLKDDSPAPGSIPMKVNARYPDGAPLTTMPASLLTNLPTLPEQLEYRIVGKHMILLDTDADIVVDYIPNAIK